MNTFKTFLLILFLVVGTHTYAQEGEDLQSLFDDAPATPDYAIATFKSTRIINGQSVEMTPTNEMIFTVSHHFGRINSGIKEFFGLDQSTVRLGLEYGLTDWLTLEAGRSSFNKMVDGSLKFRLLRQQTGKKNIPFTLLWYSSANISTSPWPDLERDYLFAHRIAYVHQLLIARKFSSNLSFQITPGMVHYNLVPLEKAYNTIPVLGLGGRYKILPRLALNAEYIYVPSRFKRPDTDASLSLGFDVETGGHVFQLFLTNSMAMYDPGFLTETFGKWSKGDIYFGFNITRVFTLTRKK
jgi:hypothetical protein